AVLPVCTVLFCLLSSLPSFFFFTHTPPPEIYTLSLHDALPIFGIPIRGSSSTIWRFYSHGRRRPRRSHGPTCRRCWTLPSARTRSEEHTSELQSRGHLVCRLLLEKKKKKTKYNIQKKVLKK